MKHRKLRIALPLVCVAAWVASYFWLFDAWCGNKKTGYRVGVYWGELQLAAETVDAEYSPPFYGYRVQRADAPSDNSDVRQFRFLGLWATWRLRDDLFSMRCSLVGCNFLWLFVLSIVAAVIPYSKRFGLRTLLIATTLIALGLGLLVYALR